MDKDKRINIYRFKSAIGRYAGYYTPAALFAKLKKVVGKVATKTLYVVLVLYYATFDPALPLKDGIMVAAALGYFILPLDFIPDGLPGGFADDAGALFYVARHIWNNLSESTLRKAECKLREWLGNVNNEDLTVV